MKNKYILIFFFITIKSFSQTIIEGTVKDENNEFLMGTIITVYEKGSDSPISYTIAEDNGKYKCSFESDIDSLLVKASLLGYKTGMIKIINQSQHINFVLKEQKQKLKEIIIKTKPIEISKDTITYRVSAFKKDEDRVLVDVLKRLPGITVRKDGTILFEGKAINKFYIENNDLLEGRYNLASNNLDVKDISSVQIYENHQPIKLLDSVSYTDRAAINIKLKKNFAFALPVDISVGYQPILWNIKTIPMYFAKKIQNINLLSSNNTGIDLKEEIKDHSLIEMNTLANNYFGFLNTSSISFFPIEKKRYLKNTSGLISLNFLKNLKNNTIKVLLDYMPEIKKADFESLEKIIINENESISNSYKLENNDKQNFFKTNLIYEINNAKTYLKTNLKLTYNDNRKEASITNLSIMQNLSSPEYDLQNNVNYLFRLGKRIINLNYNVGYKKISQLLTIKPGVFYQSLNNGVLYNKTVQSLDRHEFFGETKMSFIKKIKRFTLENSINFNFNKGSFDTELFVDNQLFNYNNYRNNIKYSKYEIKNMFSVLFKSDNFFSSIQLPIKYRKNEIEDIILLKKKKIDSFFYEYEFLIRYTFKKWKWIFIHKRRNVFDDLRTNFFSYVLINYQTLERYNRPFMVKTNYDFQYISKYKDILEGFNAVIRLGYTQQSKNLLYKYNIDNTGERTIQYEVKDNDSYIKNLNLSIIKYIFKLKTTFKLNINFSYNNVPYLIDETYKRNKSLNSSYSLEYSLPIKNGISVSNAFNYNSLFIYKLNKNIKDYQYKFKIFVKISKEHKLILNNDFIRNNGNDIFFEDLTYDYKPKNKKWNLYLNWNNILNQHKYVDIYQDDFIIREDVYYLRPSEILLGFKYSF